MLDELVKALAPYNVLDLLAKVGALHLDLRNANRATSLHALAHMLASQPYDAHAPLISRHRLETLIYGRLGTDSMPGLMDDPAAQMFTEEIVFTGGPYVVFPGRKDGDLDTLRWLLKAALLRDPPIGLKPFRDQVERTAILCLSASDRIARGAGLRRGMMPPDAGKEVIRIPASGVFQVRAGAVVFSRPELISIFRTERFFDVDIEPLTAAIGSCDWDEYTFEFGMLDHTPFVKADDAYVVPNPATLMTGLRHRILCIAQEHNVLSDLTAAYRAVVELEINELLRYWQADQLRIPLPQPHPMNFSEGVYSLDSDKAIYVQLATDDVTDLPHQYDPATWDTTQLSQGLATRNTDVLQYLDGLAFSPDRMLTLTIIESLGRSYRVDYDDLADGSLRLMISANALKSMALLDAEDPLALWKFARTRRLIRERAEVFAWSSLDEYEFYRSNNHSYYVGDDDLPNLINIDSAYGLNARKRVAERFDFHGVPTHTGPYLTEVWSRFGGNIPIYHLPPSMRNQLALVVEGSLPVPVWVIGTEQPNEGLRTFLITLINTVAYWLWQFDGVMGSYIAALSGDRETFVVELDFDSASQWADALQKPREEPSADDRAVSFYQRIETGIKIRLHPSLFRLLTQRTNQGERQLVRELLGILKDAMQSEGLHTPHILSDLNIDEAIDAIAPLGAKRMFLLTNDPLLGEVTANLPPFRSIQANQHQELLDDLGDHLNANGAGPRTFNGIEDRNTVLNEAVKYFYDELRELVATFDGDALLTKLMEYSETNIVEMARREGEAANRLACFGDDGKSLEELIEDTLAQNTASMANRFLVEYVAAQPPASTGRLSLESYDRLLAISGEIINFGFLSDFVRFGLVDFDMMMLPSGRLGFDDSAFAAALGNFMQNHVSRQATTPMEDLLSFWHRSDDEQTETGEPSSGIEAFDGPFAAEFGISLADLIYLMDAVLRLDTEREGPVRQFAADQMHSALAQSLAWEMDKVLAGLDLLTLGPRDNFFNPPNGNRTDIYPWRFNRAWSYLRRPFLRTGWDADALVMWGNRHVRFAMEHIVDLCFSGRIKAETRALRQLVGKQKEMKGDAFEDSVRVVVTEQTGIEAKGRLRKVGGVKIADAGADLGDIDVIGVIPSQRVILCIECKALAMARTPAEIQHQMDELTGHDGKPGTVQKHQRRVSWVEEHLDEVLKQCFSITRKGRWSVKPLLVSDRELFAPHIRRIPFPAWSLETLGRMTPYEIARGL